MAGINAVMKIRKKEPIILDRSQAYIGVLIDDLVTKGTNEPYRMFTSRVEYRLMVREDNATSRLSKIGHSIGLISDDKLSKVEKTKKCVSDIKDRLKSIRIAPHNILEKKLVQSPVDGPITLFRLLKRPDMTFSDISSIAKWSESFSYAEKTQIEVDVKYEGYVKRELSFINKFKKLERMRIPDDFDYSIVTGLSSEITEKLTKFRPRSLGQASRVSGVTPAAITLLMVKLHSNKKA